MRRQLLDCVCKFLRFESKTVEKRRSLGREEPFFAEIKLTLPLPLTPSLPFTRAGPSALCKPGRGVHIGWWSVQWIRIFILSRQDVGGNASLSWDRAADRMGCIARKVRLYSKIASILLLLPFARVGRSISLESGCQRE